MLIHTRRRCEISEVMTEKGDRLNDFDYRRLQRRSARAQSHMSCHWSPTSRNLQRSVRYREKRLMSEPRASWNQVCSHSLKVERRLVLTVIRCICAVLFSWNSVQLPRQERIYSRATGSSQSSITYEQSPTYSTLLYCSVICNRTELSGDR